MLRKRTYHSVSCCFCQITEDEDIKIYSGSSAPKSGKPDDDEAALFMHERDNGNIDRAKQLGALLAKKVKTLCKVEDSAVVATQKKVLYGYVCKNIIEKNSANSVLARAAIGELLNSIKNESQSDFDLIQDSVAFTKYMLVARDPQNSIGAVFAKLCNDKDNSDLICEGETLYIQWGAECTALFNEVSFV